MLTMCMMVVPPELRIIFLIDLNPIKEVGYSCVYGHVGKKTRASIDSIQKDISKSLSVLNTTPLKKIRKIFSPV